jgi:hypothetical protein
VRRDTNCLSTNRTGYRKNASKRCSGFCRAAFFN